MAPPGCSVAVTVVPVPMFPSVLPRHSSQETPVDQEDHTWVCDRTRGRGLLCGAEFSTKKQLTTHIMQTKGGTHGSCSWSMRAKITNVCPWCQLVFSNRTTTLRHMQKRLETGNCSTKGPWDQHEAISPSSLVCQVCQHEDQSLSHLLEHTRDHMYRRENAEPSQSTCSRTGCQTERSVLSLLCGHGHDRSSQQHAGRSRSDARQRKGNWKRQKVQIKEEAVAQLAKQILKNALEIRELQKCVIRVFILPKDSAMAAATKSACEEFEARFSNASKEKHQNIVSPGTAWNERRCRRPLCRSKFKQAFGYTETAPRASSRREVKLVKTRKAWDKNTVKLLLCVGPNLHGN